MARTNIRTRVLLDGLVMVESPRWHDGRLWFPHWGTTEIIAVDLEGKAAVMAEKPPGLGHSIGWLSDGRRLVTGDRLVRHERDGSTVVHADPSDISKHGWSENEVPTGVIAVVTPDGTARKVADSIAFPNGIAADGICLDAEGAVWTAIWPNECVRVAEGGEILDRIQLDRPCFATMLGGPQRNTLFMMTNQFVGPDRFDQMLAARGGQVLVAEVRTPGAGWP